jgi:hypothetical protein
MAFIQEQTGYEKTILSDLQGAWDLLRAYVAEELLKSIGHPPFPGY